RRDAEPSSVAIEMLERSMARARPYRLGEPSAPIILGEDSRHIALPLFRTTIFAATIEMRHRLGCLASILAKAAHPILRVIALPARARDACVPGIASGLDLRTVGCLHVRSLQRANSLARLCVSPLGGFLDLQARHRASVLAISRLHFILR